MVAMARVLKKGMTYPVVTIIYTLTMTITIIMTIIITILMTIITIMVGVPLSGHPAVSTIRGHSPP